MLKRLMITLLTGALAGAPMATGAQARGGGGGHAGGIGGGNFGGMGEAHIGGMSEAHFGALDGAHVGRLGGDHIGHFGRRQSYGYGDYTCQLYQPSDEYTQPYCY